MKTKRPDNWRPWTRPIPLAFLIVLFILFIPVYLCVGLWRGLTIGCEAWGDDLMEVWSFTPEKIERRLDELRTEKGSTP